ncbi:hypothetical protein L6164_009252 [Bauhinia variegata]|uniref:Uncharacterized protein n=1 Tax=Bauhinia variegata TaxID=167791 RepID=A0ACB9PJ40_BAUVA|nr:hypothetical protein L6164_009252 [Bauhinia variegata]
MKRQTSAVSSSSRRENAPEKIHAKTIGCMSGIIHFVCKSHSPRKLLTFGKKQIKNKSSFPAKHENLSNTCSKHGEDKENPEDEKTSAGNISRLSSEVPRSPTLPAEIRRSNPVKPPENFRTPPSLVVRLMGIDDGPALAEEPESVAAKRQKLLGALQKCDEDLKALKKIIDSVRSAEPEANRLRTPSAISRSLGDKIRTALDMTCSEFKGEQQQPSPVSVLDEFNLSPLRPSSYAERRHSNVGRMHLQQLQKKPGEEEMMSNLYFYDRMASDGKGKEEESAVWSSKAMTESVEEVCRDIAWGEKREIGRIGLALQDYICRDLIEEIVREFGCPYFYTLPFEACKRRLCF